MMDAGEPVALGGEEYVVRCISAYYYVVEAVP